MGSVVRARAPGVEHGASHRMWMFTRSHLHCCFSPEPTWFLPLSGGFSGLFLLEGLWHRVRNWDLQCQCILSSSTWVFTPCRELFILYLAGLEVLSLDLLWVANGCFSVLIRLEKTQNNLSRILMVEMSRNWCYVM